jgi:aspartate--ammonia ligase
MCNKRALWRQFNDIKRGFVDLLCDSLNLQVVPGPLFVPSESGINDRLNGCEEPVTFTAKYSGQKYEVVHSLAKHKR